MISETGTITENGVVMGQLQIVDNESAKRVQLYSANGYFLCETPFDGNNDKGLEMGMAMYNGYKKGWENADMSITQAIAKSMRVKHALGI